MLNFTPYLKRYEKEYLYRFDEIVGKGLDNTSESLSDLFDTYGLDYALSGLFTLVDGDYNAKAHIDTLFERLKIRFGKEYWLVSENEIDLSNKSADDIALIREHLLTLVGIIMNTYDRYASILDAYSNAKSSLMNKLQDVSSGVSRYNDTPQNEEANDEFEGDAHVTNLTKFENQMERDVMTPVARLDELTRLYNNIIKDWTNEFQSLFISEGGIIDYGEQ